MKDFNLMSKTPEAALAEHHKTEVQGLLEKVCAALNAADADGFEITFNLAKDQTRKYKVTSLRVIRDY